MSDMRPFDYARDLDAIKRIWKEVGWVESDGEVAQLDTFFKVGHTWVGTIDDVAECSVHTVPGELYLGAQAVPLCCVTAVTTSRVARGRAFAQRLTARQLAQGAARGAQVASLGIFDQGFYDKLGFGSASYDHRFTFDPSNLKVSHKVRTPVRLTVDDAQDMHAAMCARNKVHGSVILEPPELVQSEFGFNEGCFALGYRDEAGVLTHFVLLKPKGERGPFRVLLIGYQNSDQLLELLSLLKSLADQVYSVILIEPPEVQMQDLLERPFRNMTLTHKSEHQAEHESFAWWQFRILDVPGCVQALPASQGSTRLQLDISDPLDSLLPAEDSWRGVGGQYVLELGSTNQATPLTSPLDESQPILRCSVNAFSRWLWGVQPASGLAISDDFELRGPLEYSSLDRHILHRDPRTGWDF